MNYLSSVREVATALILWMASIVAICPVDAAAADRPHLINENDARAFDGVTAKFVLENPKFRREEPLKIRMILRNISNQSVIFRYDMAFAVSHIRVYDSEKKELSFRMGAPSPESPAIQVSLAAGKKSETVLTLKLWKYYDLPSGKYYLRFYYDFRLLGDKALFKKYEQLYPGSYYVLWDTRYYAFSVRK